MVAPFSACRGSAQIRVILSVSRPSPAAGAADANKACCHRGNLSALTTAEPSFKARFA